MRRALLYFVLGGALVALGLVFASYQKAALAPIAPAAPIAPEERTVQLGERAIRVAIADTAAARERGLSGRAGLAADEGMLFVFPEDGTYAFWMKDMRFPLDILWFSSDGRLVFMAEDVSPGTYPQAFAPGEPSRYVLELPAGYAKRYTVRIGDSLAL